MYKPMDCAQAKEGLAALLSEDLSSTEKKRLLTHLDGCGACSNEREELNRIWRELGTLPEAEVPKELRQATLSRIEGMLGEEPSPAQLRVALDRLFQKPVSAVIAAVAVAFLSLWVLRGVTAFETLSSEVIFLCSALWTGVIAGTFLYATGSLPGISARWQLASRIALTGLGLVMLGTMLCPKMSLVHWWESLLPGRVLLSYGEAISHGAFGLVYAFIPFFLAVCLVGRRAKGDLLPHALSASALFFILLLPAILLQALPLSSLVFFNWMVGSVLGVTMAAVSGAGVVRLTSSPQTAHT